MALHIHHTYRSPNFDERPRDAVIDMLVFHYTAVDFADTMQILCHLHPTQGRVSAHYVIDLDGSIYQLVDEDERAWHAGQSYWRGREALNAYSIGVEVVNPGHGPMPLQAYTPAQVESMLALGHMLKSRYAIPDGNIVGHSDIAPQRKLDPGEHFPWKTLGHSGLGLKIPELNLIHSAEQKRRDMSKAQVLLARVGYKVPQSGRLCKETHAVLRAFQMHFVQDAVSGSYCPKTAQALDYLVSQS